MSKVNSRLNKQHSHPFIVSQSSCRISIQCRHFLTTDSRSASLTPDDRPAGPTVPPLCLLDITTKVLIAGKLKMSMLKYIKLHLRQSDICLEISDLVPYSTTYFKVKYLHKRCSTSHTQKAKWTSEVNSNRSSAARLTPSPILLPGPYQYLYSLRYLLYHLSLPLPVRCPPSKHMLLYMLAYGFQLHT